MDEDGVERDIRGSQLYPKDLFHELFDSLDEIFEVSEMGNEGCHKQNFHINRDSYTFLSVESGSRDFALSTSTVEKTVKFIVAVNIPAQSQSQTSLPKSCKNYTIMRMICL
jgi:hypothetical protein